MWKSITSSLSRFVYERSDWVRKKSFSAPCVRPVRVFSTFHVVVFLIMNNVSGRRWRRRKIASSLSRATHSPRRTNVQRHKSYLTKYATNSNFSIHLLRVFCDAMRVFVSRGIIESFILPCTFFMFAFWITIIEEPPNVCECCCVSFFIFAKIVLKSIHISAYGSRKREWARKREKCLQGFAKNEERITTAR